MMPFASIRFFKKLVIHSYASLFIQIAATLQVKMTDNSTRWKPKITDDVGDILPTRNPCIGKNQCQSEEALLSMAVFSMMYEVLKLSMTYALHWIRNKAWSSTQREQHPPPLSSCQRLCLMMKTCSST